MECQVSIRNGTGYLLGVPGPVMDKIKHATRFRPVGFQYSPKYQRFVGSGNQRRRAWDGYVNLVKHSKFPAGLLERIILILEGNGIKPKVVVDDPREFPEVRMSLSGIDRRDYQDEAVESVLMSRRGVLRAPTGSGKSAVAARVVYGHKRRAVIVVPTIDLLLQMKRFLEEHLGVEGGIGQLGDGIVEPREVTVATIRTMAKVMSVAFESYEYGEYDDKDETAVNPAELRSWVDGIATIVFDECQCLGAQVAYEIATKLSAPNKYGFSASPWRDDGADLMIEGATGPVLYRIGTKELVDGGWLVPPVIEVIETKGMWVPGAWGPQEFAKAYKKEIVENPIRNELVARKVVELDMSTLVLVKQVNHGRVLENLIPESLFLSGKATGVAREEAYDDMRAGRLKRLICTSIADMGLDLPVCQGLVLAGGGKALDVDTLIPTPSGWDRMGDLKQGDAVFAEDGTTCRIVKAHPVLYERPCYEITFSDGAKIVADGDHLWTTITTSSGRKPRTLTTKQIQKTLYTTGGRKEHAIQLCAPLETSEIDLPVDPYILGMWLGDGDGRMRVHTNAQEISHFQGRIEDAGFSVREGPKNPSGAAAHSKLARNLIINGLRPSIRRLGLLEDLRSPQRCYVHKHIPQVYLRASIQQRLSLLQGLMDTDGHITKDGKAEWSTKSEQLRDNMLELLYSLGYKPNYSTKFLKPSGNAAKWGTKGKYGPYFVIRFYPTIDMPPVTLPNKLTRLRSTKLGRRVNRQIVAVVPVSSVPVRCIEVDSPSRLYLCGKEMIPTHNSSTRHLQRIGRVARPFPGKDHAHIVDLDDTFVHKWFHSHAKARRKIEHADWAESAIWI